METGGGPTTGAPHVGEGGPAGGRTAAADARLDDLLGVLTAALESLNLPKTRRLLALLEIFAEEVEPDLPARATFYARACRAMFALTEGDLVGAATMTDEADRIRAARGLEEGVAVVRTLRNERARQLGDREGMATGAAACESAGTPGDLAEAAVLWLESGDVARAGRLVDRLHEHLFEHTGTLPPERSDVLVVARLCEAATGSGRRVAAAAAARALEPHSHRAVVARRATVFAGVVDDYLALATGDRDRALAARAAYEQLGAWWWARRRSFDLRPSTALPRVLHLHPSQGTSSEAQWCVGPDGATRTITAMPGLDYLRALLQRPGRDVTAEELAEAVSPGSTSSFDPRRRVQVRQAIATALSRLEMHDSEVAVELRASIRTGLTCRYDPAAQQPTAWHLDTDVAHASTARRS